jgi:MoxR-like ATPase
MSEPKPFSNIFKGNRKQHDGIKDLPLAPPWRQFDKRTILQRGEGYYAGDDEIRAVNAALVLRRPLLITGKPGTGKSSLAYGVAHELGLGDVLVWPITSRSTLQQGLYQYDALARFQEGSGPRAAPDEATAPREIAPFLRLGPLGTALIDSREKRPRVLLIDEIDKSDIDLPNDLLHVFEEGEFEIPELSRLPQRPEYDTIPLRLYKSEETRPVTRGRAYCMAFPLVLLTSNGEREFPPAFERRCLRLRIKQPTKEELGQIIAKRLNLDASSSATVKELIAEFVGLRDTQKQELATDQLLNAIYFVTNTNPSADWPEIKKLILQSLGGT